jgi:hypothetical protein
MDAMDEKKFKPLPGQDERGVDLTLIRRMLELTPEQRIRYAIDAARDTAKIFGILRPK